MKEASFRPITAACPKFGVPKEKMRNMIKKGPHRLLLLLLSISNRNNIDHEGWCYVYENQINGRGWFDKSGNYHSANFKSYSEMGRILGVAHTTVINQFKSLLDKEYIHEGMVGGEKVYYIPDPIIYGNVDRALIAEFYKYCEDYDVEATLRILSIIVHAFTTTEGLNLDGTFTMVYTETCGNINRDPKSFPPIAYYSCIGLLNVLNLIDYEQVKVTDPRLHIGYIETRITKVDNKLLPETAMMLAGADTKSKVVSIAQNATTK